MRFSPHHSGVSFAGQIPHIPWRVPRDTLLGNPTSAFKITNQYSTLPHPQRTMTNRANYMLVLLAAVLAITHAHLRGAAYNATSSAVAGGAAPARSLQGAGQGSRVVNGIANTVMEDHFDIGAHFMFTLVETDDGEVIKVDTPHRERYVGERVSWVIKDKTPAERASSKHRDQQTFPERFVENSLMFVQKMKLERAA